MQTNGRILEVLNNPNEVYIGDLRHYFEIVRQARNVLAPYHNLRHMCHVLYLCYLACIYYGDKLTPLQKRELLIAAMFHDFNHSGRSGGNDDLNIQLALRGLREHILPQDLKSFDRIESMIRGTQFPYVINSSHLDLPGLILRDADKCQGFSEAWLLQVVHGLAEETNVTPLQILRNQEGFLSNLDFQTEWAKDTFTKEIIEAKVAEAHGFIPLYGG